MKGKETIVDLFFNDKKDTIKIINNGGDLFTHLTEKKTFCPLIGSKIELGKMLGKGVYGKVFEISFPGKGKRKYAVKVSAMSNIPCSKKTEYKRLDDKGKTVIPKGSSICEMEYSEYGISLLTGELFRDGTCINFLDVFAFSACMSADKIPRQYTFMEQINSSLRKKIGCIMELTRGAKPFKNLALKQRETLTNSVLIQILFTLAVLSRKYQIVHGDLHDDNVFLVYDPDLEWEGERIGDYDYYEYKIDGTSIYIPAIPLIVKIGDWGLAVKYSAPMIGNITTMENGFDQYDHNGSWLPNFFTPAYDTTFIVSIFKTQNPSNEFVRQIAAWVCGLKKGSKKSQLDKAMENIMAGTGRPKIEELDGGKLGHVSPDAILLNKELMDGYTVRPPKGSKILVIGKI